jgi:hypothetical protein
MGLCAFQKNTIVRIIGVEYTLLRKVSDTLWQLEETKSRRVVELEHDQILHHIAEGTLTFPGSKIAETRRPALVIDGADFEQAKVRRAYVQAALREANTKLAMQDAVNNLWEKIKIPENPPSYSTVQRWLSLFRQGRQDITVLRDNTTAKGNRTERYPSEVLEICRQSIENKYLVRERGTIQDVPAFIATFDEDGPWQQLSGRLSGHFHTGLLVRSTVPPVLLSLGIWQTEQHYRAAEDTEEFQKFNRSFRLLAASHQSIGAFRYRDQQDRMQIPTYSIRIPVDRSVQQVLL